MIAAEKLPRNTDELAKGSAEQAFELVLAINLLVRNGIDLEDLGVLRSDGQAGEPDQPELARLKIVGTPSIPNIALFVHLNEVPDDELRIADFRIIDADNSRLFEEVRLEEGRLQLTSDGSNAKRLQIEPDDIIQHIFGSSEVRDVIIRSNPIRAQAILKYLQSVLPDWHWSDRIPGELLPFVEKIGDIAVREAQLRDVNSE